MMANSPRVNNKPGDSFGASSLFWKQLIETYSQRTPQAGAGTPSGLHTPGILEEDNNNLLSPAAAAGIVGEDSLPAPAPVVPPQSAASFPMQRPRNNIDFGLNRVTDVVRRNNNQQQQQQGVHRQLTPPAPPPILSHHSHRWKPEACSETESCHTDLEIGRIRRKQKRRKRPSLVDKTIGILKRQVSDELQAYQMACELSSAHATYLVLFWLTSVMAQSVVPSLMMWPGIFVGFAAVIDKRSYLLVLASAINGIYLLLILTSMVFPLQGFEMQYNLPLLRSLLLWCFVPLGIAFCSSLCMVGWWDPYSKVGRNYPWTKEQEKENKSRSVYAASLMFAIVLCALNGCAGCVGGVFFALCGVLGCVAGKTALRAEAYLFASLSLLLNCLIGALSLLTPIAGFSGAFANDPYLRRLLYTSIPLAIINVVVTAGIAYGHTNEDFFLKKRTSGGGILPRYSGN